jgi:hypothetical protein
LTLTSQVRKFKALLFILKLTKATEKQLITKIQTYFISNYFRKLSKYERVYCWFLVTVGIFGGASATYTAIRNIVKNDFSPPCYIKRQWIEEFNWIWERMHFLHHYIILNFRQITDCFVVSKNYNLTISESASYIVMLFLMFNFYSTAYSIK